MLGQDHGSPVLSLVRNLDLENPTVCHDHGHDLHSADILVVLVVLALTMATHFGPDGNCFMDDALLLPYGAAIEKKV
ncbi:hypothetical protein Sste5344_004340 [Sporothrix stenoceras]